MTPYNLAVTVGPNIFRPLQNTSDDIANVALFYDLLIRMIERHEELFNRDLSYEELIKKWGTKAVSNRLSQRLDVSYRQKDAVGTLKAGEELLELLTSQSSVVMQNELEEVDVAG